MSVTAFDTLGYFEKLKAAGVPEEQARVQVEVMQGVIKSYDDASRKEIATKGDLQDVRNELRNEIATAKHEILKWVMGLMVAQTALIIAVVAFIK